MLRTILPLLLVACLPADDVDSRGEPLIVDAAHGGRPGFYFLPPLVEATPLPAPFDGGRALTARLEGGGVNAPFALIVKPSRQRYEGVLDTDGLNLDPARIYRLKVSSGTLELGYADVRVFTKEKEAKSLASDEYFELVDGKKLKIEVYVSKTGTLEVSADVDEAVATAADLRFDAQVSVEESTVLAGAPASLAAYWPAGGTTAVASLAGRVGAWSVRSSGRACAPLALTLAPAVGSFADLVEESRGAAELCAFSDGGRHYLEVSLARDGVARTATLAAQGAGSRRFESRFRAELAAPIFDGETLSLELLDGAHGPLPLSGELVVADWFRARLGGAVSFTFTPTAS